MANTSPDPRHLRLDGYVRVSRVAGRSGEAFISPDVQRETVLAYAKAKGHEVIAWHTDLDVSGGKLDRPGLNTLLARIRAGETDGLAVAKLDRLSRAGVGDALKLVEEVQESGGVVVAVDLGLDPTTVTGELVMTVLLALARMERRRMSDSWVTAKARALDRGAKIGPTPFGYLRQDDGTLALHPEEADHVREAFLRARVGIQEALSYLSANAPGRTWTAFTVRRLLANRSYLGEQHYGDEVRRNAHPVLVTRAAWTLAQHEAEQHRRPPADFPLSGIASCATCGGPMVGGRGGRARDGSGLRTYRCAASLTKAKGDRCPAPATMVATRLEGEVDRVIREGLAHALGLVTGESDDETELRASEVELEEAEEELRAFAVDVNARRLLGDGWSEALEVRAQAVEEARTAFRTASESASRAGRIVSGHERLDAMTPAEWVQLVRDVIERVEVKRGRGGVAERVRVFTRDGIAEDAPIDFDGGALVGESGPPLTDADEPAGFT